MKGMLRVLSVLVLSLASSTQAALLTLEPTVQNAQPGNTVSIDLLVSGLGQGVGPNLGAFDVDIGYDPLALSLQDPLIPYTLGGSLGDFSLGEAWDISSGDLGGLINVRVVSFLENDAVSCVFCVAPFLENLQSDSFVLASFELFVDVLAPGASTALTIETVYGLSDGFGVPLPVSTENALVTRPRDGSVPMPETLPLLVLGLLCMRFVRRYR